MGLETASYIGDLNAAWPLATDEVREGDDHLRNLKSALQAQFPNLGTSVAVLPTAAELNFVDGVLSDIQTQLDQSMQVDDLQRILHRASALPANGYWTLFSSDNDAVPLLVNSLSVAAGGAWPISGLSNGATGSAGTHSHSSAGTTGNNNQSNSFGADGLSVPGSTVFTQTHSHDFSFNTTTHAGHAHAGSAISSDGTWRPAYVSAVWLEYQEP